MTSRIPELVRRAFAVATSGRPGPVLLDVPEDVAHDQARHVGDQHLIAVTQRPACRRGARPRSSGGCATCATCWRCGRMKKNQ
jgi:acetolactate synthase I/II/III large subunit